MIRHGPWRSLLVPLCLPAVVAVAQTPLRQPREPTGKAPTSRNAAAEAAFQQGMRLERDNSLQKAEAAYAEALDRDPDHGLANLHLGNLELKRGDAKGALVHLRRAARLLPRNPAAFYDLGQVLVLTKDYEGAISAFRQALDLAPGDVGTLYQLGLAYGFAHQRSKAIETLRQALHLSPKHLGAHYNLALLYADAGQLDSARYHLNQALAIQPRHVSSRLALADLHLRNHRRDLATSELLTIAHQNEKNPRVLVSVIAQLLQMENARAAVNLCRDVLHRHPDATMVRHQLVQLYLRDQKWQAAAYHLRQLLATHPDQPELWTQLAECELQRDRLDEAALCLRKCIATGKPNAAAYAKLGVVYTRKRKPELALQQFRKAVELDPTAVDAWRAQVDLLVNTNRTPEAVPVAESALKANPDNPDVAVMLSDLYFNVARFDRASAVLEDHVKRAPDNVALRKQWVLVLAKSGSLSAARRENNVILERWPKDVHAYLAMAELAAIDKDWDDAEKWCRQGLEQHPHDARLVAALAQVQDEAGDLDAAIATCETLPDEAPGADSVRQLLIRLLEKAERDDEAERLRRRSKARGASSVPAADDPIDKLLAAGKTDEALKALRAMLDKSPDDDRVRARLAALLVRTGNKEDALQAYQDLLARHPDDKSVFRRVLNLLLDQHGWGIALSKIKPMVLAHPDSRAAYTVITETAAKEKQLELAVEFLTQITAEAPDSKTPLHYLAMIDRGPGSAARHAQRWSAFVSRHSDDVDARLQWADSLIRDHRPQEAIAILRPLTSDPRFAPVARRQEIDALRAAGEYTLALVRCAALLHREPYSAFAYDRMARIYHDMERDERGRKRLQGLYDSNPNNIAVLFALARSVHLGGDHAEAAKMARRIARARPESPEAHVLLAEALDAQGLRDDAVLECRAALAIDPLHEEAGKLWERIRPETEEAPPPSP